MAPIPCAGSRSRIFKRNSKLRAVQLLLGRTRFDRTLRHLGIGISGAPGLSGIDLL
jgi:hypothetical protein